MIVESSFHFTDGKQDMSKTPTPRWSSEIEAQLRAVYRSMGEKEKRRYAASLSYTVGHGGCAYVCEVLGCSPATLTRGRKELQNLEQHRDPSRGRQRRKGAGRPKKEDSDPELADALEQLLKQRTAGNPKDAKTNWTHLTIAEITRRLSATVAQVSWPVVKRLCENRNLKKRKQVKSVTKAPSRGRDMQFRILDRLRRTFRASKDAIFSVDSKEKEMLGNVYRGGDVLADGPVQVLDHALPSYSEGEVVSHGIYDTRNNRGHINLNLGCDTGAFACASFLWFWEHVGRLANATADRILLLMDCGGSNSSRSNVFKHNLSKVASKVGLPIRVAHLPVYCSKYNPIERRVFPHVERAYRGQIFTRPKQMRDAIEARASTSTNLELTAHVLKRKFKPATRKQQKVAADVQLEYPEKLDEYNYRAAP